MPERDWQADWELCQRATPGSWRFAVDYIEPNDFLRNDRPIVSWWGVVAGTHDAGDFKVIVANEPCLDLYELDEQEVANMRFVAEARESLPYWLQRYKELHDKWIADTEEKIRLRYTNQQLQEELVRLKDIILKFARYADDHKVVLVCPEEASECNSLCSACWQAALDGRKEGTEWLDNLKEIAQISRDAWPYVWQLIDIYRIHDHPEIEARPIIDVLDKLFIKFQRAYFKQLFPSR